MKKVVRLTESDLVRIVKRVINENDAPKVGRFKKTPEERFESQKRGFEQLIDDIKTFDRIFKFLGGEVGTGLYLKEYKPYGITNVEELYNYKEWEDKDEWELK